ncbi:metal-sulfur cluster assembly factor [Candidatus Calescamantes bacterium]|nr:metal-sulfur cluster assembly factor [bacterium]MCK5223813.1 metal-sulfur cluster assembly factor [Candidatus Calescamantes bacterium]MCK5598639.1 metal-sulfur cluster assembly factor [bacterium]
MITKEEVKSQLEKVLDPEIGIDIVSLGLIYDITIPDPGHVKVTMTLTIPGCPMASYLTQEAQRSVEELEEAKSVVVDLVFDPPWTPDMIPQETRDKLGL